MSYDALTDDRDLKQTSAQDLDTAEEGQGAAYKESC